MQSMFGDPFKLPPMKSSLGFKGEYNSDRKVGGYKITGIKSGSPLTDSGIEEGDILIKLNGRHIQYFVDLHDVLIATEPGTEVTITWLHNGEELTATVKTAKAK